MNWLDEIKTIATVGGSVATLVTKLVGDFRQAASDPLDAAGAVLQVASDVEKALPEITAAVKTGTVAAGEAEPEPGAGVAAEPATEHQVAGDHGGQVGSEH